MRRTRRGKLRPVRKRGWNYPRAGYGPIRRWVPSWRIVLASVFLFLAMGVGAVGYLYVTIDIPQPGDFALARTTTVYYSDGKTKMGTFAQYEREPIKLSDLPDTVPHAVVASEDSSFYTNSGISSGEATVRVRRRSLNSTWSAITWGRRGGISAS